MNCFWSGFFNQLHDCGRGATWFLVTLGGFFVLMVLAAVALQKGHEDTVISLAAIGGVLIIYHLAVAIRRAIQWRRHRLKFPQLSRDELNKARSKLTKRSKPARPLPVSPVRARLFDGPIY